MTSLATVTFRVDQDGNDFHIRNSNQFHTDDWAASYHALLMIRDDIQRQIDEKMNCPFHPRNVKRDGLPHFQENP